MFSNELHGLPLVVDVCVGGNLDVFARKAFEHHDVMSGKLDAVELERDGLRAVSAAGREGNFRNELFAVDDNRLAGRCSGNCLIRKILIPLPEIP